MLMYHATNKESYDSILNNGFNISHSKNENRFGQGIYFTSVYDNSNYYGSNVITCNCQLNSLNLKISEWYSIEQRLILKYGFNFRNHIKQYILKLGHDSLKIEYDDNICEIVIYDFDNLLIQ